MDASTSLETLHDTHHRAAAHEEHKLGWWRTYIFSTDHKMIVNQYGLCGLIFLFFGFSLMMLMRWQLAFPGQALPVIGNALGHLFVPGGAAKGGWTSYAPLSVVADTGPTFHPFWNGQTLWLIGFVFLITSSLLGAINFITTIIQLRAKGLTWMRLPFFVWAQFVTAFLLLLAFPPLEAAIIMQI